MEWGSSSLPPGFRFHPTDEELVGYYLKRKLEGLEFELQLIPLVDLYKFDPWELPEKSFLPSRDMEWFFFCPRDRKYPNGSRTNRATKVGYWKATGKDRKVVCQSSVIGYRKTLVFYKGRAPLGDRTNWMMHEYRLCDDSSQGSTNFQGDFAVCRVIKKSQISKRSSESCSKPKQKMVVDGLSDVSCQASYPYNGSRNSSPIPCEAQHVGKVAESFWVSPDMILDSSKISELPDPTGSWQPYNHQEISPCSSLSNFIGEVELGDDFSQVGQISSDYGVRDFTGFAGLDDSYYDHSSQSGYADFFQ